MSVDGNFVVLIHKQLLCRVLRRGVLGWVLDDDSREGTRCNADGWLVTVDSR